MPRISTNGKPKGKIRLDWRAYFYQFLEEHGEPVETDGVLLFHDGWRYSCRNYQGPEYPPPTDQRLLRRLQQAYWTKLKQKYTQEAGQLRLQIQGLEERATVTSLPLQQRLLIPESNESGFTIYRKGEPTDLNLTVLKRQLTDLRQLTIECNLKLQELS